MKLKQVKLIGFKSFVDSTILPLNGQLIGVVGPNGCGKSNIIDAIRWVLGENSTKDLRGESMQDVIFNGSSSRKPIGCAAVELLFDNLDDQTSKEYANFNEIAIRREISRDQPSEYYLNNKKCRKRDIIDLFIGTGILQNGYAIISQGTISKIIESKPEELRSLIEEAADISIYKKRRHETELRMLHTQENLQRLQDLVNEQNRLLIKLEKQANVAQKYQKYQNRKQALELKILSIKAKQYQQNLTEYAEKIHQLSTELEHNITAKNQINLQLEQKEFLRSQAADKHQELQEEYYQLTNKLTVTKQELQYKQQQHSKYQADLAAIIAELAQLIGQQETDHASQANLLVNLSDIEKTYTELKVQHESAEQSYLLRQQDFKKLVAQLHELQLQWQAAANNVDKIKHSLEQAAHLSEEFSGRILVLTKELNDYEVDRWSAEINLLTNKLTSTEDLLHEKHQALLTKAEQLQEYKQRMKELAQDKNNLQTEIYKIAGKIDSLKILQHELLELNDHKLAWLTANNISEIDLFCNHLVIAPGWELAVGVVLNQYLDGLLSPRSIDSFAPTVWSTISHFRLVLIEASLARPVSDEHSLARLASDEHSLGRPASDEHSLAQPVSDEHSLAPPASDEYSLARLASDDHNLVKRSIDEHNLAKPASDEYSIAKRSGAQQEFMQLVTKISGADQLNGLLANALIAENLLIALANRKKLLSNEFFITNKGEMVGLNWLKIDQLDNKQKTLLRKKELADLTLQLEDLQLKLAALEELIDSTEQELVAIEQQHAAMIKSNKEQTDIMIELTATLSGKKTTLANIETRSAKIQAEITDYQHKLDDLVIKQQEFMVAVEQEQQQILNLGKQIDQINDQKLLAEQALAPMGTEVTYLHNQLHAAALQREQLMTKHQASMAAQDRLAEQITFLQQKQAKLTVELNSNNDLFDPLEQSRQSLLAQQELQQQELAAIKLELNHSNAELDQLTNEQDNLTNTIESIRAEIAKFNLEQTSIATRFEDLLALAKQQYLTDLAINQDSADSLAQTNDYDSANSLVQTNDYDSADSLAQTNDHDNLSVWQQKLDKIVKNINKLGAINLSAIEEFTLEQDRKVGLEQQLQDLSNALTMLKDAILTIDVQTKQKFKVTFDQINHNFQQLFPKLFGGGTAYIELIDNNVLSAGVTVFARPPGKKNSSIYLLSGGEKALTAVALIFAIFELNPSPFCVLDEVDAPLDDANVVRFGDLLVAMSAKVQFIFITHNKTTMQIANQLIGVTMKEPGISKLVSVHIDEAAAFIN